MTQLNEIGCTAVWIPPSHQLSAPACESCRQIAEHCESGWKPISESTEETIPIKAKRPWIMSYFKGNEKTGYTYYPPWLREMEPPKLQPSPVARLEKPEATIKRLTADIQKNMIKLQTEHKCANWIGSKIDRYVCVATDGHRGLLVKGAPAPKKHKKWGVNEIPGTLDEHIILDNPDIMLGLMRLVTVLKEQDIKAVKLIWDKDSHELAIEASCCEASGIESYAFQGFYSGSVGLNPQYLIPMCGTWPITMYCKDAESPVIFMPESKKREFMYVIMPTKL